MSEIYTPLHGYKSLEIEVNELESIDNWNDKINKMKELKEKINLEQEKLNNLISSIVKYDITDEENNKSSDVQKMDLDYLIHTFKSSQNLDEKIKLYQLISTNIRETEKQLFE
jgi:NADH:ubiquinone oxidoreductase subunit D